jgi:hypothetical protein
MSGRKLDELEELDASVSGEGFLSSTLHRAKRWLMSHSQYLNFPTILLLASVSSFLVYIYLFSVIICYLPNFQLPCRL